MLAGAMSWSVATVGTSVRAAAMRRSCGVDDAHVPHPQSSARAADVSWIAEPEATPADGPPPCETVMPAPHCMLLCPPNSADSSG